MKIMFQYDSNHRYVAYVQKNTYKYIDILDANHASWDVAYVTLVKEHP